MALHGLLLIATDYLLIFNVLAFNKVRIHTCSIVVGQHGNLVVTNPSNPNTKLTLTLTQLDRGSHKATNNTILCLLYMSCILAITAGDLHPNPGPSADYACGLNTCQQNVSWNDKALLCDNCEKWYHHHCVLGDEAAIGLPS